ncbi:hypothetical protein BEWA_021790 [Theileria equi strain WA]|uniref:Diphthine--ammonia ligase n=1 Tax=Theileria equi strain WA TaxID=1537102 RepID=L0AWC4_THEEQ|nr:hypothetical protein BEWA_021790 [Theileria equi strain WA]AFZ79331.1 hypothetical protein BEWA_021790 [Theileria equi strain WA]|eukprot:XP_004828997.1 hypothetical protein BEWA_021790 [Theileria equi strain WA]
MKLLSLISGGKDGIYAILSAKRLGHDVVLLGHLNPLDPNTHELDSYMYQTIGHNVVLTISTCMEIPLIERPIGGTPKSTDTLTYLPTDGDEVEDLYELVKDALEINPSIEAVLTGAIASKYQLERVKNVCDRLNLKTVQPLWGRDQGELLRDMVEDGMIAILMKACCMGISEKHLGKTIRELYPEFMMMEAEFGFNVCGEGGEYESMVLDCPLYKKRIRVTEHKVVYHSRDPYAPTILYVPVKWVTEPKS